MKQFLVILFIVFCTVALVYISPACTTMIITKGASADGSMMVAHSDDDELGDQRLILVPGKFQQGKCHILDWEFRYPRINTNNRGPGYYIEELPLTPVLYELPYEEIWDILGYTVEKSYAYFDGNYGIMNEHNLMFGECTNAANYVPDANADKSNGNPLRIFYSAELSRIALENCKTAREAIKLMGALIDEYGYYSMGETLLVGDGDEAWVFEMCALPDDEYHSAWVAQRVVDGEVFVAANEFRIRYLQEDDPDKFLYSKHLIPGLEKVGWWNEEKDGPVDWLKAVSPGEFNHPYYTLRRIWRVFDRINPDLALSPWVEDGYTFYYPFSIKPSRKLEVSDVFSLFRDHYEGTQFDLTKGMASGPYGYPNRFTGPYDIDFTGVGKEKSKPGAWERPISVFYQGYTYVCQFRPEKPEITQGILWYGPDVSYTTCFFPFFSKIEKLAESFQTGNPQVFTRTSAWWAFNFVNNWSKLNFQHITRSDIQPLQKELENHELDLIEAMDDKVKDAPTEEAKEMITKMCLDNSEDVLKKMVGNG